MTNGHNLLKLRTTMKKQLFILATVAAAMLASCSADVTEDIAAVGTDDTVTLSLNVNGEVGIPDRASRLTYTDGQGITWDADTDASKMVIIYSANDISTNESGSQTVRPGVITVNDDKSATFTTTVPAGTQYIAYHLNANEGTNCPKFLWSNNVTQAEAGVVKDLKLYSEVYKLDITDGSVVVNDTKAQLAGALIRVFVYSTEGSTAKVKSVRLHAKTIGVCGGDWYNFMKGNHINTSGNDLTVTLTTPFDLTGATSAETSKGVYLPINIAGAAGTECTTTTNGVTYTVTMENGDTYTFDSTADRTWTTNHLYDVLLNLDKATTKPSGEGETTAHTIRFTSIGNGDFSNYTWTKSDVTTGNSQSVHWIASSVDGATANDDVKDDDLYRKFLKFEYEWTPADDTGWVELYIGANDNNIKYNCSSNVDDKAERSVKVTAIFDEQAAEEAGYKLAPEHTSNVIYTFNLSQTGKYVKLETNWTRWTPYYTAVTPILSADVG